MLRVRVNADILDGDSLAGRARDLHINGRGAKATLFLEEVVVSAGSRLPSLTAVNADLKTLDGYVGVDDLHGEPPLRSARLVVKDDGRGDTAGDELV